MNEADAKKTMESVGSVQFRSTQSNKERSSLPAQKRLEDTAPNPATAQLRDLATLTSNVDPQSSTMPTQIPDRQQIAPAPVLPETENPNRPIPEQVIADTNPQVAPPRPEPKRVTVEPGTPVQVQLAETLSSDHSRTGDTFRATLAAPLVVDGLLVAGKDSTVLGRVASAHRAPILGRKADVTLTLTDITAPDGRDLRINTNNLEREGSRSGVVNTAKMATGAAVGAVVGALTGAAEGAGISSSSKNDDRTNRFMATNRTVVLPAGTQMTFNIASPLKITQR